jgi:hypothetical protein
VFIANLPPRTTTASLRRHVESLGVPVSHVWVERNARGDAVFAFVELGSAEAVERTLVDLPARRLRGCPLRVERARTPLRTVAP